jgi:hypothetical protein
MNQAVYPVTEPLIDLLQTDPELYQQQLETWEGYLFLAPTNNARIVFMAIWANYSHFVDWQNWNSPYDETSIEIIPSAHFVFRPLDPVPTIPPPANTLYEMNIINEQQWWWHDTPENQPLTDYFTNVLDAVRLNRNWTNYYALCRSGLTNTIEHISEYAESGLVCLIFSSSDDELQYMDDDPLLPVQFKEDYIEFLRENPQWRFPPWTAPRAIE